MTGKTFGDYTIGPELGKGGMATVYLARNNKFMTDVAIKVLNREFVFNDNIRSRFLSEARKIFRMSHPNIIRVTDLIDEGELVAFVMEYVEGVTLKQKLEKQGKSSDDELKQSFGQVLRAVGYVHAQGLVHRDIKPSNFMIRKDGTIILLDFGIAKTLDPQSAEYTMTATSQNMGTPMYMSPEQIRNPKDVDALSDIYSLGVVLWQMVTGRKPYDANTMSTFDMQSKIVNDALPATFTIWDKAIATATSKKPADRFASVEEFRIAISAAVTETIVTPEPDPEATLIMQPARGPEKPIVSPSAKTNHSTLYIIVVLLVLAIIVILVQVIPSMSARSDKNEIEYMDTALITTTDTAIAAIDSVVPKLDSNVKSFPEVIQILSYLDNQGRLIFGVDCYIIVQGSWPNESEARQEVARLRSMGYDNAGYLWIPDYPSLSGVRLYASFFGPYHSIERLREGLDRFPKGERFFYGKIVSKTNMIQEEIR